MPTIKERGWIIYLYGITYDVFVCIVRVTGIGLLCPLKCGVIYCQIPERNLALYRRTFVWFMCIAVYRSVRNYNSTDCISLHSLWRGLYVLQELIFEFQLYILFWQLYYYCILSKDIVYNEMNLWKREYLGAIIGWPPTIKGKDKEPF